MNTEWICVKTALNLEQITPIFLSFEAAIREIEISERRQIRNFKISPQNHSHSLKKNKNKNWTNTAECITVKSKPWADYPNIPRFWSCNTRNRDIGVRSEFQNLSSKSLSLSEKQELNTEWKTVVNLEQITPISLAFEAAVREIEISERRASDRVRTRLLVCRRGERWEADRAQN